MNCGCIRHNSYESRLQRETKAVLESWLCCLLALRRVILSLNVTSSSVKCEWTPLAAADRLLSRLKEVEHRQVLSSVCDRCSMLQ